MARGGPELTVAAIFRTHRCHGGGKALEKTLHGAPAASAFLDFDQKRAFSRPGRRFRHRRNDVGFGGVTAVTQSRHAPRAAP